MSRVSQKIVKSFMESCSIPRPIFMEEGLTDDAVDDVECDSHI